jgi:hypothetical protein
LIDPAGGDLPVDELMMLRLRKKQLALRDEIARVQRILLPTGRQDPRSQELGAMRQLAQVIWQNWYLLALDLDGVIKGLRTLLVVPIDSTHLGWGSAGLQGGSIKQWMPAMHCLPGLIQDIHHALVPWPSWQLKAHPYCTVALGVNHNPMSHAYH